MIVKTYPVSTSQFGVGFEEGSNKTPTGNFIISEKLGKDELILTIFKARKSIGVWDRKPTDEDLVLSRILWLDGVDMANSNTKNRFIYIHGTNQENLIGTPASHGCVRMRNKDVVELFNLVEIGAQIFIG